MEQFKRFGIDFDKDNFVETSIYGIACVYALIEKEIENCLKQHGLSTSRFNMMMVIKHQSKEEGISQVDIGKRLVVTASNMTKQLDKLIAEGFVERFAQQGDRRVNLIKITQKGSELLDKIWPDYYETISGIADKIPVQDRETLSRILASWFEKLEK